MQQRLREPHKAVYAMAMIGVVQEAQFPKFADLASRLERETLVAKAIQVRPFVRPSVRWSFVLVGVWGAFRTSTWLQPCATRRDVT